MSEEYDAELEEIKRRKLLEYQKRLQEASIEEERRKQEELKKQELLRKILTPKARERLYNLKMVKPQLVEALELQIIQLASTGRVKLPITDDDLKRLLLALMDNVHKDIKIRYSFK
ncbi:MAG: DNA-binding protein [Thermoproteales archaeon]|nr:DNA-binding protein [Thermoproteales archaeon]